MTISSYSTTAGSNTSISGINIAEGCAPGNINDAIRQLMADVAAHVSRNFADTVTAGGTANVLTLTLSPAPTAYTTGMLVKFKPSVDNTDAATININGLGEKSIYAYDGINDTVIALTGGELKSTDTVILMYRGTGFVILFPNSINLDSLGTMATQSADSVSITGGSASGFTSFSTSGNAFFGASSSIMAGEGVNASYRITVQGGAAPITLERSATSSTGQMIEAKTKRGTSPAQSGDYGARVVSSWNDSTGTLAYGCGYAQIVDGTVGSGFVPSMHRFININSGGTEYYHMELRTDGKTKFAFAGRTTLSEVCFIRFRVNFNASGTITDSLNVSSVTKNATGDYTINFTNAMPTATYTPLIGIRGDTLDRQIMIAPGTAPTTTSLRVNTTGSSSVPLLDVTTVYVAGVA